MRSGKRISRVVLTVLLAAGVALALFGFLRDNAERISTQNEEYINELTTQRALSIDNLIAENLNFIRSAAYLFSKNLTAPVPETKMIQEYEDSTAFDMLRFVAQNGDNHTSRGIQANLVDRAYFQAGMRGESGVTYVLESRVTGQKQIGFYAPVEYEEKIVGVLVGFYGEEYINRLLSFELFGSEGISWLCLQDGTILGTNAADAEADTLTAMVNMTEETREKLLSAMREGRALAFQYLDGAEEATGYMSPLSQADWVLIRSFPPAASQRILNNANREGILLIVELVILFAVYGSLLALGVVVEQRRTREANQNAQDVTTGVSSLFEKFVTLDLRTETYKYVSGSPETGLMNQGDYESFRRVLLQRIEDPVQRREVDLMTRVPNLFSTLRFQESLSLRAHFSAGEDQWFTYNFIVIEREGDEPARVLIVRQNVTELRQKEEQEQQALQAALDAAEQASRAKSEFLFNMSHDLRTPMNAIIGYTDLAEREGVELSQMKEFIHKISSSGKHLLALINDILEMSRIESGKTTLDLGDIDLRQQLTEARDLFFNQMNKKNIAFSIHAEDLTHPRVQGDEGKMNRILLNLISNAFKFTMEGGTISVTLRELGETEKPDIHLYELRVKDNGIGMSEEYQTRLFTPFERERTSTVSRIQGTGLGLSITKSFVDMMGGEIQVKSRQGEGTEFIVRLPLPQAQAPEKEEKEPSEAAALDFSRLHLLLVEDNEINREIATMILTSAGFTLETAVNGQEAVERVSESPAGTFDAILMDVQMPVMDGYTATRKIRALPEAKKAGIPILAMTANAFQEDIQTALDAGMNGHIAKPLDIPRMMETLTQVLSKASSR